MLSQIRQKKKKEAVRRLSQGASSSTFSRERRNVSLPYEHGEQFKGRMFSGVTDPKRRPGPISNRPVKRRHISPLDRSSYQKTASVDEASQSSTNPSERSAFASFTALTNTDTAPIASSNPATNVFGQPVSNSRGFLPVTATSHSVNPVFGGNLSASSLPVNFSSLGAALKFGDVNTVVSSGGFGSFSGFGTTTSINPASTANSAVTNTFGNYGGFSSFSDVGKDSSSLAVPQPLFPITNFTGFGTAKGETLASNSLSSAKPVFPVLTPAETNRPSREALGGFGLASVKSTAKGGTSETLSQEKTRNLVTAKLTGLVLKDIPESFNKNSWLKRFYSRFGEVMKVLCNASKKSATVIFKTHEAADAAKRRGKVLRPGLPPITIFWKQQGSRRSTSEIDHEQHNSESEVIQQNQRQSPEKHRKTGSVFDHSVAKIQASQILADIQRYLQSLNPCQHAGDKLQVLEGVDKKLRQVFERPSDIRKAEAVVGTCKDMCPEKERYMREYQRRLSVFESISGSGSIDENPQVNHSRAVKEYDRSAADKEEPLPHELRPVPVLKLTMDYLATNIMDAGEGIEAEWFDFLWNRTRGIRKDITQQHLCDPDCVELVEKTARFHIFCAHFLCEADMNTFDAKINTENLTKCLQTLKQFYGDLFKDKGITCPLEAEFRAYDILLNLNEGDILREVMTFRDEVQNSPQVRFAMAIFHALNSNNFVRFFRLLRNASYLNACLLHRYFTQVRSKAIQTLNHSMGISIRTTSFPLKDLLEILAFENESEAGEFCSCHGLSVSEGCVLFSRSSFIKPETRFPPKRAWVLIESKREVSIGEVVYNGPLPPSPQHQPGLSFNEQGVYVGDVKDLLSAILKDNVPSSEPHAVSVPVETESQVLTAVGGKILNTPAELTKGFPGGMSAVTPILPSATITPPLRPVGQVPEIQPKVTVVYSGEEMMTFTKKLFVEVINEMFTEITKEALDKVHFLLQMSQTICGDIVEQTASEVMRESAKIVFREELEKKRLAEEEAASRERVSLVVQGDVMKELMSRECARIVQEVIREAQEELRVIASKSICLSFLEEETCKELWKLVSEVIEEEKAVRKARLHELALRVVKGRTFRYFRRWLKAYEHTVYINGLLSAFPPGAPILSAEEQLMHLVGHTTHNMKVALTETDAERNEGYNALKKRQYELEHIRRKLCKPLDVPTLLADAIRTQPVAHKLVPVSSLYWKVVISFPDACRSVTIINHDTGAMETSGFIKEKFKRGMYPVENHTTQALKNKVDLLSLYRAEVRTIPSQTKLIGICAKACYGVLTNTEQREVMETKQFHGACALMFVVYVQELLSSPQVAVEARVRLRRILESKPPLPSLPVAIALICDSDDVISEDIVCARLEIPRLKSVGLLSDWMLWRVDSFVHTDETTRTLCSMVTWLGRHLPRTSAPKLESLTNFVEDGIQREFTVAVAEDFSMRRKAKLEQQCPEAIIELFNSVLDHLADVITSGTLQRLSWPVTEFCNDEKNEEGLPAAPWNSPENFESLRILVLALKLPSPPPAAADGTWKSESDLCLQYARSLAPDTTGLINRVKWILDRTRRRLEDISFLSVSPRLSASQVPWPLVLDACVNFKLTSLHLDPSVAEKNVYYSEKELEKFRQPTLWRQTVNLTKEEAAVASNKCSMETAPLKESKRSRMQESFVEVERGLKELNELLPARLSQSSSMTAMSDASRVTLSSQAVTPSTVTQGTSSSLDNTIQATSNRLQTALEKARAESTRFEELLKDVLIDRDSSLEQGQSSWGKRKAQSLGECRKSPKLFNTLDVPNIDTTYSSLEERLICLNATIRSQRRSDQFTERRLEELLRT